MIHPSDSMPSSERNLGFWPFDRDPRRAAIWFNDDIFTPMWSLTNDKFAAFEDWKRDIQYRRARRADQTRRRRHLTESEILDDLRHFNAGNELAVIAFEIYTLLTERIK